MRISHRFGSAETLSRARYWLTRHGFEVAAVDPATHDSSRLSLNVDFSKAQAALALIDSIERSDPDGWPGVFASLERLNLADACQCQESAPEAERGASASPIGWHHRDEAPSDDPTCCKVCEYMFSRWE